MSGTYISHFGTSIDRPTYQTGFYNHGYIGNMTDVSFNRVPEWNY
jgi:hypothetical protein